MTRDEIIKLIRRLPADATESDVLQELFFRLQVEKGASDAAEGRVLTHDELKNRISQWRTSGGC